MKTFALIVLLFSSMLSSHMSAADSAGSVHWYMVVINMGAHTREFTGSSAADAVELASKIANANTIELDNRRAEFGIPNRLELGWQPNEISKVFIMTKNILYFVELPGDPAVQAK